MDKEVTLKELFEKYIDEFDNFNHVLHKFSNRPKVHALILLDRLVKGSGSLISTVEGYTISFNIPDEDLLKVSSERDVCDLCRCGVFYDESGIAMFIY